MTVNTYIQAAAGLITCHECCCSINPPCNGCVNCETCNPCFECDEVHEGPRNDDCPLKGYVMSTIRWQRRHKFSIERGVTKWIVVREVPMANTSHVYQTSKAFDTFEQAIDGVSHYLKGEARSAR